MDSMNQPAALKEINNRAKHPHLHKTAQRLKIPELEQPDMVDWTEPFIPLSS